MLDLLAIGDLMVDFTPMDASPKGNPVFEQNPGGAPANVCVTLARLGGKAGFIGAVGDEVFGHFLAKRLDEYGVDRSGLRFSKRGGTKLAFVTLDENHERSFYFAPGPLAEIHFTPEDVDTGMLDQSKVFLLSTVSQYQEPIRSTSAWLCNEMHRRGKLVAYDPNWNCAFSSDPEYERNIIRSTIARADIVKISIEEANFVFGEMPFEEIADWAMGQGVKLFLITLGAKGCFYRYGNHSARLPAFQIQPVDTTGAGDAFTGALIYALTRPETAAIESLTREKIESILVFASACGAICATKRGAMPSVESETEVARFICNTALKSL